MASLRRWRAAPVSTCTFHGWVLVPEGARAATSRISRIVASGTGVGRKARIERRDVIAASTAVAGKRSLIEVGFLRSGRHPRLQHRLQRLGQRHRPARGAVDVDVDEVAGGRALGRSPANRPIS